MLEVPNKHMLDLSNLGVKRVFGGRIWNAHLFYVSEEAVSSMFQNIAYELLAGVVWVAAVALGMWIENRFDIIPRKSKRDREEMAMVHSAHKYIRHAEREKAGSPGMEKMDYAIALFQEDFDISYRKAYDLLSEVFATTELYHNGSKSHEPITDYNE